jgi:hypothetical protein
MVHHSSCLLAFKSSFNRTYLSTVDTKNTREYWRGNQKKDNPEKKKRIVQYPFYCCEFKGNIWPKNLKITMIFLKLISLKNVNA